MIVQVLVIQTIGFFIWIILAPFCRHIWDFPFVLLTLCITIIHTVFNYVVRRGPLFSQWTFQFELLVAIQHMMTMKYGSNLVLSHNAKWFNQQMEWIGTFIGHISCKQHDTRFQSLKYQNLEHIWIYDKHMSLSMKKRFVLVYYHGGGFVFFGPRFYIDLANRIRKEIVSALDNDTIQIDVLLINYRKAPESKFPAAVEDALTMFEYVCNHEKISPHHILVAGDSAGGGLVLSTLLELKDKQHQMPLAAVVLSPFIDYNQVPAPYCVLSSQFLHACLLAYLKTPDDLNTWKDHNLQHLSPLLIQSGTLDYLYSNSLQLYHKALQDGVMNWTLNSIQNMPHNFIMIPKYILPHSQQAIQQIGIYFATSIQHQLIKEEI